MKESLRWIHIWIMMNSMMLVVSLSYFYLSHELSTYASVLISAYLFASILPYIAWKYRDKKYPQKHSIVIQILKD